MSLQYHPLPHLGNCTTHITYVVKSGGSMLWGGGILKSQVLSGQVSHCCATTFEFCKPLRCKSLLYHLVQSYSDFLYLDLLGKGGASLLQQTMPSPTWRHNHFEDSSVLAHGIAHAIANVHGDLGCKYWREKLTNELVPQSVPLLQLGRRDDQTVDEGQKHRPKQWKVVRLTKIQQFKVQNTKRRLDDQ